MAYLTKAKEQNTQNEKTDQTKKNKVSVILIESDCELHYHAGNAEILSATAN